MCCRGDIELFISRFSVRYHRISLLYLLAQVESTSFDRSSSSCNQTCLRHKVNFHSLPQHVEPATDTTLLAAPPPPSNPPHPDLTSSSPDCFHPSFLDTTYRRRRLSANRFTATASENSYLQSWIPLPLIPLLRSRPKPSPLPRRCHFPVELEI